MYKFFEDNFKDNYFALSKENLKHIKVLRIRDNEEFEVVCDEGKFICILDENRARILRMSNVNTESDVKLKLFMGICKGDKLETIIKQATEIGVTEFFPVNMMRSDANYTGKEDKKLNRFKAIALSAAKQSKRDIIPIVHGTIDLDEIGNYNTGKLIIPYELEETKFLKDIEPSKDVSLVIGPEGGFDPTEIEKLRTMNGEFISLGKRILRAETAAIVSVFMVIHTWEES